MHGDSRNSLICLAVKLEDNVHRRFENQLMLWIVRNSQKNYDKGLFKNLLSSSGYASISMRDKKSNSLQVIRSDSGNCMTEKLLS